MVLSGSFFYLKRCIGSIIGDENGRGRGGPRGKPCLSVPTDNSNIRSNDVSMLKIPQILF